MTAIEKYVYMRQAGFSHDETQRFINNGVQPNVNTNVKQKAYKRLTEGETNVQVRLPRQ